MTEQRAENFILVCEAFIDAILNRADPDDPQQCINEANEAALDLMGIEIDFWAAKLRDQTWEVHYDPDGPTLASMFYFIPAED